MNPFSLQVWNDECEKCAFYTVQFLDKDQNETDEFFEKYFPVAKYEEDLNQLVSFIIEGIGNRHGAIDDLLNRHEGNISGLPNTGRKIINEICYHFPQFTFRIYALKISDEILVLLSGGIKDGPTNQTSSLLPNWRLSTQIAEKIVDEINSGMIINDYENRRLLFHNGSSKIIIY